MKFNRILNLDAVIRNCIICNSADHYNFEVVEKIFCLDNGTIVDSGNWSTLYKKKNISII